MRLWGLVCVLAARLALGERAAGRQVEVTTRNFDEETARKNLFLVFYAPWCGHCKRLEPVLQQLAASPDASYTIGKCDGTEHRVLAQRFGVRGYPSLYYIRSKSEVIAYDGSRAFKDLDAFLRDGYKTAKQLSLLKSPFGPIGRAKGLCVTLGLYALDAHEHLAKQIGVYPAYAAIATIAIILLVIVLVVPLLILA